MTLGRLVVAWLAVTAWSLATTYAVPFVLAALARPPGESGVWAAVAVSLLWWRPIEALVLTLLAVLWFASLGSGGWWLVFLLLGVLAMGPRWPGALGQPRNLLGLCAGLARYVGAGAILAWILR